jgi:hypothetical protein
MSIAIVRATHLCLRGSCVPSSQMSNRRPYGKTRQAQSIPTLEIRYHDFGTLIWFHLAVSFFASGIPLTLLNVNPVPWMTQSLITLIKIFLLSFYVLNLLLGPFLISCSAVIFSEVLQGFGFRLILKKSYVSTVYAGTSSESCWSCRTPQWSYHSRGCFSKNYP